MLFTAVLIHFTLIQITRIGSTAAQNQNGITYSGDVDHFKRKASVKLSFVDENKKARVLKFKIGNELEENTIDFDPGMQRYTFPIKTKLDWIFFPSNSDNECQAEFSIDSDNITAALASCSKSMCAVNTKRSVPCTQKTTWLLDKAGLYNLKVAAQMGDKKLEITIAGNVTNQSTSKLKFHVILTPAKKRDNCELVYDTQTEVQFRISSSQPYLSKTLYINDRKVMEPANNPFTYEFVNPGEYITKLNILPSDGTPLFTWTKTIKVVNRTYSLLVDNVVNHGTSIVKTHSIVGMKMNSSDDCVASPELFTWDVDSKEYIGKVININFSRITDARHKVVTVRIKELPTFQRHLHLYNSINTFVVKTNRDVACINSGKIEISLAVSSGTEVRYQYQMSSSQQFVDVDNLPIIVDTMNAFSSNFEFKAINQVSVAFQSRVIQVKESKLNFQFSIAEKILTGSRGINARVVSNCNETMYYSWTVDNLRTTKSHRTEMVKAMTSDGAFLSYVFVQPAYYKLTLEIKYGKDNSSSEKDSKTVQVLKKISFSMPVQQNGLVNQSILLQPNAWAQNNEFEYRWQVDSKPFSEWTKQTQDFTSAPLMSFIINTTGKHQVTLEVKNALSSHVNSTKVFVYNPIAAFQVSALPKAYVAVNSTYKIQVAFPQSLSAVYTIQLRNKNKLNHTGLFDTSKSDPFIFSVQESGVGVVEYAITVSNPATSVTKNLTIHIVEPIHILNITLQHSTVLTGEKIKAKVFYKGVAEEIVWSLNQEQIKTNTNYLELKTTSVGQHTLSVSVENQVNSVKKSTLINVGYPPPPKLTLNAGLEDGQTISGSQIYILQNESVIFSVHSEPRHNLVNAWNYDGKEGNGLRLSKILNKKGEFELHVNSSSKENSFKPQQMKMKVFVRANIVSFNLITLVYDKRLLNESTFTGQTIDFETINFRPKLPYGVMGNITCFDRSIGGSKLAFLSFRENIQSTFSVSVGNTSVIICRVVADNRVSAMQHNYVYIHRSKLFVNFENFVQGFVFFNASTELKISISRILHYGKVFWYQNEQLIETCTAHVVFQSRFFTCTIIFDKPSTIKVSVQNMYYTDNRTQHFKPIKKLPTPIQIGPIEVETGKETVISVKHDNKLLDPSFSYKWSGFESTTNTISVNLTADKRIGVNISSPLEFQLVSAVVKAYPYILGGEIEIHDRESTKRELLATNEMYTFKVAQSSAFLDYVWSLNNKTVSTNAEHTRLFTAAGFYTFSVNISSPMQYKVVEKRIEVLEKPNKAIDISIDLTSDTTNDEQVFYVPSGSSANFTMVSASRLIEYKWSVEPQKDVEYKQQGNSYIIDFAHHLDNKVYKVSVTLNFLFPKESETSTYNLYVCKSIGEIKTDLSEYLLENKNYTFTVSWNGSGTYIKRQFNMTGVHSQAILKSKKNSMEITIVTLPGENTINTTFVLCNKLNCVDGSELNFISTKAVTKVDPFPSKKFVPMNSSVVLEARRKIPNAVYKWYILNSKNEALNETTHRTLIGKGALVTLQLLSDYVAGDYIIICVVESDLVKGDSLVERFLITVYKESCSTPHINLGGGNSREHIRSLWFYSELKITTTCNLTHNWTFYKVADGANCSSKLTQSERYMLTGLSRTTPSTNSPTLALAPRLFEVGNYCVKNSLRYGIHGSIDVNFYLTVKGTALVPQIAGGLFRVIGNEQEFRLDASSTMDPDVAYPNTPNLIYRWQNKYVCDNDNSVITSGKWNTENSIVKLKKLCLQPLNDYLFEVDVRRNEMEESVHAIQHIYVIEGTAPLAEIKCFTCEAYKSLKYVRYKQMKLFTWCTNCGRLQAKYHWQIIGLNDNVSIPLDSINVLSPLDSTLFILDADVLDGIQPYKVIVNVSVDGMQAVGSTSFVLNPNPGPTEGSCTISPQVGESLKTPFTVRCSGWKDPDNLRQPFIYQLLERSSDTARYETMYRGIQASHTLQLPLGDVNNEWKLEVMVHVEDAFGSYTVVNLGMIKVSPPEEGLPLLLKQFEINIASKDTNKVTSTVLSFVKLLHIRGEGNKTHITDMLIKGAADLKPSSLESFSQISTSLNSAVKLGDKFGIGSSVRPKISSTVQDLLDLADAFSHENIELDDADYESVLGIITSNAKHASVSKQTRQRRETSTSDYDFLSKLYRIVLSTTIAGQRSKLLKSDDQLWTYLEKNNGNTFQNRVIESGPCKLYTNINKIDTFEGDVSQVLECSTVNPYHSVDRSSIVATTSFYKDDHTEIPVDQLTRRESVIIKIPTTPDTSLNSLNVTIHPMPNQFYVAPMPSFNNTKFFDKGSVHIRFELKGVTSGDGIVTVYLSKDADITHEEDSSTQVLNFGVGDSEQKRTYYLPGKHYSQNSVYNLGILHDFETNITLEVLVYTSHCLFWNENTEAWSGEGCQPTDQSTVSAVACRCDHMTAFTSSFSIQPNPLNFNVLAKADFVSNPVALATCVTIVALYIVFVLLAWWRDCREQHREQYIPLVGPNDGFYRYEVRFKTGAYPFAGTTANVGIQIFGTSCTTKVRVLKTENSFQRNAVDIFRISVDKSIGKVHKINVWIDNSGAHPSWYLERVVIRSLVNGEKFFFFCNSWLGADFEDGRLEREFHVADTEEMQRFSTIFYDVLGRLLSDSHLWLSVFERPKFSRFTRVQRVTCLVTLVLSWTAVNAMWFRTDTRGTDDLYLGFQSFSLEELTIALITVIMVFPLNLLFLLLFKKSRQMKFPEKKMKIWKASKKVQISYLDVIDETAFVDETPLLTTEDSTYCSSVLTRKKKFRKLNLHQDLNQELGCTNELANMDEEDLLQESLHLPRSFNSAHSELRQNSRSIKTSKSIKSLTNVAHYSSVTNLHHNNDVMDTLPRSRSVNSLDLEFLLAANEEATEPPPKERIAKQELISLFEKITETGHDQKSDHSSGIFYQDPRTLQLIRKNEMLAEKLKIPEIIEYDRCTHWTLPHWCVYVGYLCCVLISALSITVILTYGQQFGYHTSIRWLKALVFGFLEDIFLVFPFLLIAISTVVALIVKPLDLDQFDHYDFLECEEFARNLGGENTLPLTGLPLEAVQSQGTKQKHVRRLAKTFLYQVLLAWLVCSVTWLLPTQSKTYHATSHIKQQLETAKQIKTESEYWSWVENAWLPFIYDNRTNDNDKRETRIPWDLIRHWNVVSHPTIRQQRYKEGVCTGPKHATMLNISRCLDGRQTQDVYATASIDTNYLYAYDPWTRINLQGYLITLPKAKNVEYHLVNEMLDAGVKEKRWFDSLTQSVSHELVLEKQGTGEYVYLDVTLVRHESGLIEITTVLNLFRADVLAHRSDYFVAVCVVLLLLFSLASLCTLISKTNANGLDHWRRLWNIHLFLTTFFSLFGCTLYLANLFVAQQFRSSLKRGQLRAGATARYFSVVQPALVCVFAFLTSLTIVRFIRLLRWTSIYRLASNFIKRCNRELMGFFFIHLLVTFIFSTTAFLLFEDWSFRAISHAFTTTFALRWRKNYDVTVMTSSLGKAWFVLWTFYWMLVAVNMFRAIAITAWSRKKGVDGRVSEMMSFFWRRLRGTRTRKSLHVRFLNDEEKIQERPHYRSKSSEPQLPPLPFKAFDLDSNLRLILAGLEKMVNDDVWEQEAIKSYVKGSPGRKIKFKCA